MSEESWDSHLSFQSVSKLPFRFTPSSQNERIGRANKKKKYRRNEE